MEGSVSLDERITRTEAFIYTCLSTSDGSFEVEGLMFSMWAIGTQTLRLLGDLRGRRTTMQSRMATSSVEVQNDRAEGEVRRLILSGLSLRVRRIERSFGDFCLSWIRKLLPVLSRHSASSPTGNLLQTLPPMSIHEEWSSSVETLTEEMIGYNNLVLDLENWD